MSNNLKTQVAIAASMRATAHSWEAIAKAVGKSVKTCQNWPKKHPDLWNPVYADSEKAWFQQMSKENQAHLHAFMRDPDKKLRFQVHSLWMRHGAKAYGSAGSMTIARNVEPEKPKSKNAQIIADADGLLSVQRERMDAERARNNLPPIGDDEFTEQCLREFDERAERRPLPMYYVEESDSAAPPTEAECGPPAPKAELDRPANRDMIWGVLLLAVLITERAPVSRDAESSERSASRVYVQERDKAPRPFVCAAPSLGPRASCPLSVLGPRASCPHGGESGQDARGPRGVHAPAPAARELSLIVTPEAADMPTPIYLVDAFTDRPFSGNPAGVCLPADDRDHLWMQAVAAEMNQAETAFLRPRSDGDWDLRWFTPTLEVDLCGHATLASAHVLWESKRAATKEPIRFHTRSGVLSCAAAGGRIEMDFPAEPATPVESPAEEAYAIGAAPVFVGRNRMDMLVVLDSPETLRQLTPDMGQVAKIKARGVIVTARSDRPGSDFISRFFAPQSGVPEDPVTGSAHCCLGPYWRDVLGKSELVGYQASKRGGTVAVRCAGDRVFLGGTGVTVSEGVLR